VGLPAGYSAYVILPSYAALGKAENAAKADRIASLDPQASNASNKTDRLPVIRAALTPDAFATNDYTLASAQEGADIGRFTDAVAAPAIPDPTPSTAEAPAPAAAIHPPLPPRKPKRAALPSESGDILGDGQIAGLKSRLRLTPDQMAYWPAVETALREVARTQLHFAGHKRGRKVAIDVNSPEVQNLISAAMPLLMRLREDQKGEVRKLARVIGLEQVASQI
jgi:hypothetical protein